MKYAAIVLACLLLVTVFETISGKSILTIIRFNSHLIPSTQLVIKVLVNEIVHLVKESAKNDGIDGD